MLGRVHEPQTVANIAREIGHARQGVQRIADALVREGLIAYTDHPTDRRTKLLELTPDGLAVLTAIYTRQVEWSNRVLANLDPEQLHAIADALESIAPIVAAEINA